MTPSPLAVDFDGTSRVTPGRQLIDHIRRIGKALDGFRVFPGGWSKAWLCYALSPLLNRLWRGRTGNFPGFRVRWGEGDLYTFANLFEDYPVDLLRGALADVELVLDLGANVGAFSFLVGQLTRDAKRKPMIAAIEPNTGNVEFLRRQPFAKGLTIHHAAVGPDAGIAQLIRGKNSVSDYVDFSGQKSGTPIPVLALDELVDRPALVKMDIEGGESSVLEKGLPANVRYLVLEWHADELRPARLPCDLVPGDWKLISDDIFGSSMWYFRR